LEWKIKRVLQHQLNWSRESKYIRIGGSSIEAIRKKGSRVYETGYPVELVCYTRAGILPGKVLMEQALFFQSKRIPYSIVFDEEICEKFGGN
jgi:hypothetical protein